MPKLLESSVKGTLFRMAYPMLVGTLSMNTYNLADTYFVSRLGTLPLAAMGFTFPVVMLLTFIAGGIGTGVTTLTSHALGKLDRDSASRIVTHGVFLIAGLSITLAITGYLTIDPIFSALGAKGETLPLIRGYMNTWYFGAVFMAFPMMGNGILIALGDSKSASRFMAFGAILNCALDPIFIFGFGLGIWGAALATVISQACSSIWLYHLLKKKHGILHLGQPEMPLFTQSFRRIMGFAIPGSISMMLMPISAAVITALISRHGVEAVAGASAASRIEMFAFVIPMALGMSLVPFVSQNFGAGRIDRIFEAKKYAVKFAFYYGIGIACLFFLTAPYLAKLFTEDEKVAEIFIMYVRTISFGYGMMEIHRYSGFFFTGIHKPVSATLLNGFRILILLIPLSYLGSVQFGIRGIFFGRLLTDIVSGFTGFLIVSHVLKKKKARSLLPRTEAA